jgi:hypothetical protein
MARRCRECRNWPDLPAWAPEPRPEWVERRRVRRLKRHLAWYFRRAGHADPNAEAARFLRDFAGCTLRVAGDDLWQGLFAECGMTYTPPRRIQRPGRSRSRRWALRRELGAVVGSGAIDG